MPLPLTIACFSKIQIGFSLLVPAHLGSSGQRAVKRVCVCVHSVTLLKLNSFVENVFYRWKIMIWWHRLYNFFWTWWKPVSYKWTSVVLQLCSKMFVQKWAVTWSKFLLQNSVITSSFITGKPTWMSHTHTHTRLTALCPGLPGWAVTRKVKPIWILLKQDTVSGSGIHWAICKSAPRSRQITMPAPHRSVFYRPDALPAAQLTVSKHMNVIELNMYYVFVLC